MLGILIPTLLISIFGLFNLLGIKINYFYNQLTFLLIGLILFFIIKKVGKNFFYINSRFFYWFFMVLLMFTYFIGSEIKGSKRWIDLYFFNFQPSEIFKIFFILFFSHFFIKETKLDKKIIFFKALFYFLLPFLIILKQPDLANALVYAFIFFILILFSRLPKKYLFNFLLAIFLSIPLGWLLLKPYQKTRILSFFNPHLDSQGTAYNMLQSIITVGSGRFLGRGLGLGTQSRFYFLPENHTDFAFASLVEQFGFLGGGTVIFLFFILFFSLVKKTIWLFYQKNQEGRSDFLFILGFLAYLLFQVSVNIGMNLGLVPIAGVSLPLISYGGTSLVTFITGLVLLL